MTSTGHRTPQANDLGAIIRAARGKEGWSVETACGKARLGHMTWRRIEDGFPVREKSYAALDVLFGLPAGTIGVAARNGVSEELRRQLGVAPPTVDAVASAEAYIERLIHEAPALPPDAAALVVRSFARTAGLHVVPQESTAWTQDPHPAPSASTPSVDSAKDEQARVIGHAVLALVRALAPDSR